MNAEGSDEGGSEKPHTSLFIDIRTIRDAEISRDRGVIAASLICLIYLITLVQLVILGTQVEIDHDPNNAEIQRQIFLMAGIYAAGILIVTGLVAFIATRNSPIAAAVLLAVGVLVKTVIGLGLGVATRFFIVVTALNCLLGVLAIHKLGNASQLS